MIYATATASPTLATGQSYRVRQVMGGPLAFDVGTNKATGFITKVTLIDANQHTRAPMTVYLFEGEPGALTNRTTPTELMLEGKGAARR